MPQCKSNYNKCSLIKLLKDRNNHTEYFFKESSNIFLTGDILETKWCQSKGM